MSCRAVASFLLWVSSRWLFASSACFAVGLKSSLTTRTKRPLNFVSSKEEAVRSAAEALGMIAVASPDSTTTFDASTPRKLAMEATSEPGGTGLTRTRATRPSSSTPTPPPPPPAFFALFAAFFASRAAASSGDRASLFSFLAFFSSDPITSIAPRGAARSAKRGHEASGSRFTEDEKAKTF